MGQALRSLVFRPPVPPTYMSNSHIRWLPTKGGSVIPAVYLQRKSSLIILYSHGNAEDLGLVLPYARRCADVWGVSFFCYEYTGYGLSAGGCPSEEHLYSDVEAAYHYLTETLHYSPSNIISFGKSLGSIPATHVASLKCGIAALVLQSGLASIFRIKLPHIPGKYPGDMGCNIDKIGRVKCPVLILHGSEDTLCTLSHAKKGVSVPAFSTHMRSTALRVDDYVQRGMHTPRGVRMCMNAVNAITSERTEVVVALASKHAGITVACFIEGAGHNDLDWPPFLAHVDIAVVAFLRRVSRLVEARNACIKRTLKAYTVAEAVAGAAAITNHRMHTRATTQAGYTSRVPLNFLSS